MSKLACEDSLEIYYMVEAILKIRRWGNGLGLRLSAAVAREAKLRVDQRVRVTVDGEQLIITPDSVIRLTLAQRLDAYDIKRHGSEQMKTTAALGAER